jgi:hypothetical protein
MNSVRVFNFFVTQRSTDETLRFTEFYIFTFLLINIINLYGTF